MDEIRYEALADRRVAVLNRAAIDNLEVTRAIANIKNNEGVDDPFHVYNLNVLIKRYALWKEKLPRVQPYYAVKCNDDPVLIRVLAALGAGFDCATRREIDQIVAQGVDASTRIIYANPCKTRSFVKHASRLNVRLMTFDSAEELLKVKTEHDDPQLILRIAIGDPSAQCPLSIKFGCEPPLEEGPKLLQMAAQLGVPVVGISFHVGSGCNTPSVFREALRISRALFDVGIKLGHAMTVLDIGGGFPGEDNEHVSFEKIVSVVAPCLEDWFPAADGIELIGEPGRFFAAAVVSEAVNVVARKRVPASRVTKNVNDEGDGHMYYVNDGVYGSFNCILFDHAHPKGYPLFESDEANAKRFPTVIWGPTCDGLDQLELGTEMRELQTGDWIYYPCMGAYTTVASTTFNGFDKPSAYYFIDSIAWESLFPPAASLYDTLCSASDAGETASVASGTAPAVDATSASA